MKRIRVRLIALLLVLLMGIGTVGMNAYAAEASDSVEWVSVDHEGLIGPGCMHALGKTLPKEPTCTEDGNLGYYVCTECDKLYSDDKAMFEITLEDTVIKAKGHQFGEWVTTKAPTYEETGLKERECAVCHWKEQKEIPALKKIGWVKENGCWYYYNADGSVVMNAWMKDRVSWCYLNCYGRIMKNKWIKSGGFWYYLKPSGYMAANEWAKDSCGWMYMDVNGKITKNKWVKFRGYWYYLKGNGYMATGRLKINGKTYQFDLSGKWIP